jgi:hypothetical protein
VGWCASSGCWHLSSPNAKEACLDKRLPLRATNLERGNLSCISALLSP